MNKTETALFFKQHGDEFAQMRLDGFTNREIAEKYNLNAGSVGNFLTRMGIKVQHREISQDEVDKVINMYSIYNKTIKEIGKEMHIGHEVISNILKSNGIKIRQRTDFNKKYHLDETYFDKIDTPNKAYILGLLYADGNVSKKGYIITLSLQERDKHILESINKELNYDKPLVLVDNSSKKGNVQNSYVLRIHNKYMANSLNKCGVVPCKSHILKFPFWLNRGLMRHFIRGYLDGDGNITKNPKYKHVSFIGSGLMMDGLKEFIEDELKIHCSIYYHPNKSNKIVSIGGGIQAKKLLDYLYKDADMYLIRKYNIYEDLYVKPFINNSQIA